MKVWILAFSIALFAGGTFLGVALQPKLAPPPPPPAKIIPDAPWGGHRELSVHRFASELDLTAEQDRELDFILGETQNEVQALGRAMRSAQDRSRDRVLAILTEEQKKKLDGLLIEERVKRAETDVEKTLAAYEKVLTLTPDQMQAMRAVMTESRNKRHEYFRERKHGGDHSEIRTFMRTVREAQTEAVRKILTPEQFARYQGISELDNDRRGP